MELYTLDSLLRREQIFDQFESLIWTERFAEIGDFELVIQSTPATRLLLTTGVRVAINKSKRVMEIETVVDTYDTEGRALLKIRGKDLVKILNDRVAADSIVTNDPWEITDYPANIARYMFDQVCGFGWPLVADQIPFLVSGTIYLPSTIPEPDVIITWYQERDSLYNAIKKLVDLYDLGFRLVRNGDESELYFDIYSGSDRTATQTILSPVVFSRELDNLQNTKAFKTIDGMKTIAYVFSPAGVRIVTAEDIDPDLEGFERRVLVVKSNLAVGTSDWQAKLDQEGARALAESRSLQAFDGEISQNSSYQYEVDYYLGDLVEMRNTDDMTDNMRVTEQIFVEDQEGERSYPTLSSTLVGNPD